MTNYFFVCMLSTLSSLSVADDMMIRQVHVITRSGSRSLLPDGQTNLEKRGDNSVLSPIGQRQQYDLGVWLRNRYVNKNLIDVFDSTKIRIESSDFDRTILSANALATGLFPKEAHINSDIPDLQPAVPVYTTTNVNDIVIRPFDKCNTYLDLVDEYYESDDFKQYEEDHMPLLQQLGKIEEFSEYIHGNHVALKYIWNVYDKINMQRTECYGPNKNGVFCKSFEKTKDDLSEQITSDQWDEIQSLAQFIELGKYSSNTKAGHLLGSNALNQILKRMQRDGRVHNQERIDEPSHFFVTSAHYQTILGLFAVLDQSFPSDEIVPDYAAALIFELYEHTEKGHHHVKALYKPGGVNSTTRLLLGGPCEGQEMCHFSAFEDFVEENALHSEPAWCRVCDNDTSDVCMRERLSSRFGTFKRSFATNTLYSFLVLVGVVLAGFVFHLSRKLGQKDEPKSTTSNTITKNQTGKKTSVDKPVQAPPPSAFLF